MSSPSYDDLFASATDFHVKHKTEFTSEAGEALRLTVRQDVKSKAGLKQLGRSVLVFDFEPVGTVTAESSPTASGRAAPPYEEAAAGEASGTGEASPAAAAAGAGGGGGGGVAEGEGTRIGSTPTSSRGGCVVFFHDRYNGAKQLYINRALVYGVKKECTDGNMNSWVLPLPFGRPVLRLTSKLLSSSGFEYSLTLGGDDKKSSVLYKSTQ